MSALRCQWKKALVLTYFQVDFNSCSKLLRYDFTKLNFIWPFSFCFTSIKEIYNFPRQNFKVKKNKKRLGSVRLNLIRRYENSILTEFRKKKIYSRINAFRSVIHFICFIYYVIKLRLFKNLQFQLDFNKYKGLFPPTSPVLSSFLWLYKEGLTFYFVNGEKKWCQETQQ